MKPIEKCTVAVVGMGLMGSAIAGALRRAGAGRDGGGILVCDRNGAAVQAALDAGIADEGYLCDIVAEDEPSASVMLGRACFVYVCLNPSSLLRFMKTRMESFKSGALITDAAGVKGGIVSAVEKSLRPDLDFIPGHPMAGAEKGGFENAGLVRFAGKNYIITPLERNKRENLEWLKDLLRRMGFGCITETTAPEHDRKIAFTSQLCHVIAAALIDCQDDTGITRFGGGSFEDLTRIAMLNAPMWTELFIENRTELLACISRFEGSLDSLKKLVASEDAAALEARLTAVRERRTAMGKR